MPPNGSPRPTSATVGHSIFLASIVVAGLRGIAGEGGAAGEGDGRNEARPARLGLRPGPGLTLVVGRNGSGKSSFAEAAELALYGTSRRWQDREKAYEGGWANLHHDGPRFVEVRLVEKGLEGETVLRREWPAAGELRAGTAWAQRRGGPRLDPAELGLGGEAIAGWRPFLSYNELGSLFDAGPAKLYDSLSAVLGLEDWVEVGERLGAARKLLDERRKRVEQGAKALRAQLAAVEDERAAPALRALPTRGRPDLDALAGLATATPAPGSDLAALEELAALAPVDVDALAAFAAEVRAAERRLAEVAGTDAAGARRLAQLLEQALEHHEHEGDGPCHVCKAGSLDATWAGATRTEASHWRDAARDADDAARAWRRAGEQVPGLLAALPRPRAAGALPDALDAALVGCLARREQLLQAAGEPAALAALVESGAGELAAALEQVRAEARAELDRRRDVWQPVASAILGFLPVARLHEAEAPAIDALKRAEDSVANETTVARNERFAPIKAQARECWSELGQRSNIRLDDIVLTGNKTRRRVELGVSVDDYEGVALGVMSQGELHAMALSLFLPRAMLPPSESTGSPACSPQRRAPTRSSCSPTTRASSRPPSASRSARQCSRSCAGSIRSSPCGASSPPSRATSTTPGPDHRYGRRLCATFSAMFARDLDTSLSTKIVLYRQRYSSIITTSGSYRARTGLLRYPDHADTSRTRWAIQAGFGCSSRQDRGRGHPRGRQEST